MEASILRQLQLVGDLPYTLDDLKRPVELGAKLAATLDIQGSNGAV